jgi:hypothetical protein
MIPVSPVIPGYEEFEVKVGEGQKQYFPIPTVIEDSDERRFISRWNFTAQEREQIAAGGQLIFQQLTFGEKFQPISMYIEGPQQIDPNEQRAIPDALGEPYERL